MNYRKHFFQLLLCCLFFTSNVTHVFASCDVLHVNSCPTRLPAYCSGAGVGLARRVTCCTTHVECNSQPPTYQTQGTTAGQPASTQQHFSALGPTGDCVQTAIGCIPFTASGFVEKLFPLFISFGGAIAFLLILFGGVQMMTSAGNPEKLAGGKELIVSAITGLLLIIFSIFILRIIGYDILHIPGFGN